MSKPLKQVMVLALGALVLTVPWASVPATAGDKGAGAADHGPDHPRFKVITGGEKTDIKQFVVADKTTLIDFFSEYCPPCKRLSTELRKLVELKADLVVIKIDVNRPGVKKIDFDSPVATQYQLEKLPTLMIFEPGKDKPQTGDDASGTVAHWLLDNKLKMP